MRIFPERIHHACGVDQRGAGVDGRGYSQSFRDFSFARATLDRRRGMHGDTTVTTQSNSHRKRNKLVDFRPEQVGFLAGPAQRHIALDRVGAELADILYAGRELFAISFQPSIIRVVLPASYMTCLS